MTSPTPYQVLPRLTEDEFQALRTDIAEHGIRVPVDVDEAGVILDGHHRSWIAAELGVECPRRVLTGLSDEQKREHAVAVNVHRRNLTREQRRELVARLRSDGMSTRRIASAVGVSQSAVMRDLEGIEPNDSMPSRVSASDGRSYPASRSSVATPPTETTEEHVVVNTTTGEIVEEKKPRQRPRRALPEAFKDATYDLSKVVDRLTRLAEDDRFPRNAEQVAAVVAADLHRAAEHLAQVVGRIATIPNKDGN